jgi:RNA polymerase sigma-70 factor (ECF subfamily)
MTNPAEGPSDQALLARAADGDEQAFVLIYERHRNAVFRFARRMLGSAEAAEDVVHDCFLSLIVNPLAFDASRASLPTYLCGAARNQSLRRILRSERETADELPEGGEPAPALERLLSVEVAQQVQDAVLALPPLQREVVILVEYEELSLSEVAEIVDADVGAVKARLHRARVRLRKSLMPMRKGDTR